MNKDKIKKGLECCALNDGIACKDCPYNAEYNSHCADEQMCKDALTLITEQEKEIEQLKFNISKAQDQILATAQKNQEYREQQVKQAKQETAREILQRLWEERNALGRLMILETDLTKLAKEYDIELE